MKSRQQQDVYTDKLHKLQALIQAYRKGKIELRFADEVGVSLVPVSAAGWQHKQEQVRIFPQRNKRFNIFGLMNLDKDIQAYWRKEAVTSEWIADCIDQFVKQVKKPTMIVLDNAAIHKSKLMQAKIKEWEKKQVYFFFLPAYSPHLNAIEIFWKQLKFFWLKPQHYLNLDTLWKATFDIIENAKNQFSLNLSSFLCVD